MSKGRGQHFLRAYGAMTFTISLILLWYHKYIRAVAFLNSCLPSPQKTQDPRVKPKKAWHRNCAFLHKSNREAKTKDADWYWELWKTYWGSYMWSLLHYPFKAQKEFLLNALPYDSARHRVPSERTEKSPKWGKVYSSNTGTLMCGLVPWIFNLYPNTYIRILQTEHTHWK